MVSESTEFKKKKNELTQSLRRKPLARRKKRGIRGERSGTGGTGANILRKRKKQGGRKGKINFV